MIFVLRLTLLCWSLLIVASTYGQSRLACENDILFDKAEKLYKAEDYDAALELYQQLINESENLTCQAFLYYRLGKINTYLSAYALAINNYQKALDLINLNPNQSSGVKTISGLAFAYSKLGEFEKAYDLELEALKEGELKGSEKTISRSRYQLGGYALNLKRYQNALEHYLAVEQIMKSDTLNTKHISLYIGIGCAYLELNELEDAIKYLKESERLSKKFRRDGSRTYAIGNLAVAYTKMQKYDVALNYFNESLELQHSLGDQEGIIGMKLELGRLWVSRENYIRAEHILLEATGLAKSVGSMTKLLDCYEGLTNLFKESKQLEKAYDNLEKYTKLKDELLNEESLRRIENQKTIYESERKEAEIAQLKKIQLERELNDRLEMAVIFTVTLLLLLGLFLYDKLRKKNISLELISEKLEEKNVELAHFAYVASHDLKAPLRTISSFTNLLERRYITNLDSAALEYMEYIHRGVHQMKNLLDDLLNYSRVDQSDAKRVDINSLELFNTAIENLKVEIDQKDAQIIFENEHFPQLQVVPSQIIQLLQNLLGNALKFVRDEKPIVIINWNNLGDTYYRFQIKDNGIGIDPNFSAKIFDMFTRLHNQLEYDGTGIGLATCRKIVESYSGKIWVESEVGKGASFYFTLPVVGQQL